MLGAAQLRSGIDRWLAYARRGCSPQRWMTSAAIDGLFRDQAIYAFSAPYEDLKLKAK